MKCLQCEFETENGKVLANHVRWKHVFLNDPSKKEIYSKKLSEKAKISNAARFGELEEITVECAYCGNEFRVTVRSRGDGTRGIKKCCSRKCASKYSRSFYNPSIIWTEEKREKASIKSKQLWKNGKYDHLLIDGKSMWNSFREIEIREFLKSNHPTDNWSSGLLEESGSLRFNVDMFSRSLKIIVEYDGIWHFKDIHGQLEKKQLRDSLLENWCLSEGWGLLRIDEDKKLDLIEIENLIYKMDSSTIVKVGARY